MRGTEASNSSRMNTTFRYTKIVVTYVRKDDYEEIDTYCTDLKRRRLVDNIEHGSWSALVAVYCP